MAGGHVAGPVPDPGVAVIALVWGRQARDLIEDAIFHKARASGYANAIERLQEELADLREQNTELVKEMLAMKREGFEPYVPVKLNEVDEEPELPAEVREALLKITSPGTPLWAELEEDAIHLLRDKEPDEVARITLRGGAYRDSESYA